MARSPVSQTDDTRFEEPILQIERKIEELSAYPASEGTQREIDRLKEKLQSLREEIFAHLSPWQKTLVARHPRRPYTLDYIRYLVEDFVELHGDRGFGDDPAVVGGFGFFNARPVCILGHQKGRDTREKVTRNFGMPRPEGYRKARRLMDLADRYGRPILSFIDTPGAYPGIDAEERGQAEAIASNLHRMARLRVPFIATVTGEGGSGGALALAMGDFVNILEHAVYSVISPEGCAAILWKDQEKWKQEAARAMKITAQDLHQMGLVDAIIPEVPGGAHTDAAMQAQMVGAQLEEQLDALLSIGPEERMARRHEKYRKMGSYLEVFD
jgi:acetyl-CoA carboxylase carboxyl transferase subunit alpha